MTESVLSAATAGTRRELLEALRDKIAAEIDDGVPARDLASLSLRLMAITEELDGVKAGEGGDDVGSAADTPDEEWPAT